MNQPTTRKVIKNFSLCPEHISTFIQFISPNSARLAALLAEVSP
jgi:hypothetical protein